MGNAAISHLSPHQFSLLREEFELTSKKNLSDAELYGHMSKYLERNLVQDKKPGPCTLKFVAINDVYEIDLFPNYATCRQEEASNGDLVIGILPGDFVAPSLLSSLDKGYGMVDCMNLSGIDYVCIGNHENDITLPQLHDRIRQSKFAWINSNMQTMPVPADLKSKLPEYVIIEVKGGGQSRRVALLGLNTEDPAIYSRGAFGGCTIEPLMAKAKELHAKIMATENVDAIIPLTHQLMPLDRQLAATGLFPVIMGAHDHEPYLETISDTTVVKSGMDAKLVSICTVTWPDAAATKPTVAVDVKDTTKYAPMPKVAEAVVSHKKLLVELERSALCKIPETVRLSSVGMRLRPTTIGTFICSTLRDSLGTECCTVGAGSIRANRSYDHEKSFTYAHLKMELPFDTEIAVVRLPGKVICDMISYTREFALRTPPVEKGCYLQSDDGIEWDRVSNRVTKIAGEPPDDNRMYSVAINLKLLHGMDNVEPLLRYKASCPPDDYNINRVEDSGMHAKEIIVAHFSKLLLYQIVSTERFEDIDKDGDGQISKQELMAIAQKKFGDGVSSLMINNLFNVADLDGSGLISASELMHIYLSAMSALERVAEANDSDPISVAEVADCLLAINSDLDRATLLEELAKLDLDGSGFISMREYNQFKSTKIKAAAKDVVI